MISLFHIFVLKIYLLTLTILQHKMTNIKQKLLFSLLFLQLLQACLCFKARNPGHDGDINSNYLHDHWFGGSRLRATQGMDTAWNYCDIKCTTLQKHNPNIDFFVATFGKGPLDPTVTECFAREDNGKGPIKLWSQVANSSYYYNHCGGAMKTNFFKNPGWALRQEQGVGIGKAIIY